MIRDGSLSLNNIDDRIPTIPAPITFVACSRATAAAQTGERVSALTALWRYRLPELSGIFALNNLCKILPPQVSQHKGGVIAGPKQSVVADRVVGILAPARAPSEVKTFVRIEIQQTGRDRNRYGHHRLIVAHDRFRRIQCFFQLCKGRYKAIRNGEGQTTEIDPVQKNRIGTQSDP